MTRRVRPLLAAALLAAALTGCGGATTAASVPAAPPAVTPTTAPAAPATAAPLPASTPVRVRIPSAGVDASPVLRLGLAADGTVEVPPVSDGDKIGWYTKGVTPGETGPAVLIGHFDTARGPGVLKDVSRVRTGDEVSVTRADGSTAVFRVRELEQVDKKTFPTAKVYGDTTRPELRVITCGGELTDGHRPDNIILYADLVG
ncbi:MULTISPECIES: class F sortase [unclassified Streptomyces]|uniref:class F sortase n=1 Tax=unclassified Streptomyces TaxID=2593676 RepID=UPI002E35065D|nr:MULTISPECIES: class F sortase [unclassified Streptomyces]WUC64943.1 class F sortase [Streptomyces sp. NBC_00539]